MSLGFEHPKKLATLYFDRLPYFRFMHVQYVYFPNPLVSRRDAEIIVKYTTPYSAPGPISQAAARQPAGPTTPVISRPMSEISFSP